MSFAHGRHCELLVEEFDYTELFRSASCSFDVDTSDSTTFRKNWKTHVPGMAGGTVALDGLYDAARTDELHDYLALGVPLVATVGPAGLKVGDLARLLLVETTNLAVTSPVADVVGMVWSLLTTDPVYAGWSLRDVTALQEGTGTSTSVDTGAAVAGASWCAHFHLVTLDATSATIVVQDSADGSTDWQPITGVTSGSLSAVGSLRVEGTGDVRRHIRASVTITGGNEDINYGAAFARRA